MFIGNRLKSLPYLCLKFQAWHKMWSNQICLGRGKSVQSILSLTNCCNFQLMLVYLSLWNYKFDIEFQLKHIHVHVNVNVIYFLMYHFVPQNVMFFLLILSPKFGVCCKWTKLTFPSDGSVYEAICKFTTN